MEARKFFAAQGNSLRAQSPKNSAKSAKGLPGDSTSRFLCDLRVFALFALESGVHGRWLTLDPDVFPW
jgi:hypothetical protein